MIDPSKAPETIEKVLPAGTVEVETGYTPRVLQQYLHSHLKRFSVLVCHRRFGKTVFAINEMVDQGLRCILKNPQYAYVAPTYGQAKRVAWEFLKEYTRDIPNRKVNEAELRIDIHRSDRRDHIRYILLGAENPDTLAGMYLDGVLLDEYSLMNPKVWSTILRPALSDRKGWAIFIGTPRGNNHFASIYQIARKNESGQWFSAIYRASETDIIDADELIAARIEMSEDEYDQEFECSFTAALQGSYYGKYMADLEKKGRITTVEYDPAVPVDTFWDLGISDTTAIWYAQQVGPEIHLIDYDCYAGRGIEFYVKLIKDKPYVYRDHILPHDAAARELGTGKTRQETFYTLGLTTEIQPRQSIADGINAARLVMPKCWFDKSKCADGIEALKNYQRKWDSKLHMFLDKPLHDWSSNGSDAFRYLGLGFRDNCDRMNSKNLPRMAECDYDELGL